MLATVAASERGGVRPQPESTQRALLFVYFGYAFRYLYLAILVPFYAHVLGPAEYGRVLAAMSLFQIVWAITEYGFAVTGTRDTAACRSRSQLAALYGAHLSARSTTMLLAGAIGLAGTFASPILREQPIFGLLASVSGVFAAFNLGWYFQGQLRFRTSVVLEVLGFAINLALVLLLVRGPADAFLVLGALAVSTLVCSGIGQYLAVRGLGGEPIRLDLTSGVTVIRASTPLFLSQAAVLLVAGSSTYLLSLFEQPQQVGWYGVADRICAVGLGLLLPANQVLVGTVSRWFNDPLRAESAYRLVRKSLLLLPLIGIVMLVATHLVAPVLVPLLFGEQFSGSLPILMIASWIFPLAALSQVLSGQILIPLRRDGAVLRVSLFAAASTVVLMFVLAPRFQGAGVAWARVLGALGTSVALVAVLWREQLIGMLVGSVPSSGAS